MSPQPLSSESLSHLYTFPLYLHVAQHGKSLWLGRLIEGGLYLI